jgi:hypothetical protein
MLSGLPKFRARNSIVPDGGLIDFSPDAVLLLGDWNIYPPVETCFTTSVEHVFFFFFFSSFFFFGVFVYICLCRCFFVFLQISYVLNSII